MNETPSLSDHSSGVRLRSMPQIFWLMARALWAWKVRRDHRRMVDLLTRATALLYPARSGMVRASKIPCMFASANASGKRVDPQSVTIGLGMLGHADEPRGAKFLTSDGDESTPEKQGLDQLHFRKIDLSDEIYVVNVGGYVGSSTRREIAYARERRKRVEWMFPDAIPADLVETFDDLAGRVIGAPR